MSKIDRKIRKSQSLIQWMDQKIDGLEVSSDDRTRISAACFDIALEHQKSIVLLIAHSLFGSAFSLVRILFEAYIRGLWIGKCATDKEIEDFKKNKSTKTFATLIEEIEQQDGFQEGVLSRAKTASWKAMNSYTHSGFFQSVRRNKDETIEPNYDYDEILEVLGFSDSIGMLTALQIALMAGNVELANDLLEKSKTELKMP
jgi:hypothetical protein